MRLNLIRRQARPRMLIAAILLAPFAIGGLLELTKWDFEPRGRSCGRFAQFVFRITDDGIRITSVDDPSADGVATFGPYTRRTFEQRLLFDTRFMAVRSLSATFFDGERSLSTKQDKELRAVLAEDFEDQGRSDFARQVMRPDIDASGIFWPGFYGNGLFVELSLLLIGWGLYLLTPHARGRRRLACGLCPRCKYDLRGRPEACPECGWQSHARTVQNTEQDTRAGGVSGQLEVTPNLPSSRPVRAPLPCIHCGYQLQGLRSDGNCPECGTPIEATTLLPLIQSAGRRSVTPSGTPLRRLAIALLTVGLVVVALRAAARWLLS